MKSAILKGIQSTNGPNQVRNASLLLDQSHGQKSLKADRNFQTSKSSSDTLKVSGERGPHKSRPSQESTTAQSSAIGTVSSSSSEDSSYSDESSQSSTSAISDSDAQTFSEKLIFTNFH